MKNFKEFLNEQASPSIVAMLSKLNKIKSTLTPQKTLEKSNEIIDNAYMALADLGEDLTESQVDLNEAAMDVLNALLASAEYKALLKALEDSVDELAIDSDDYTNVMKQIVPKLLTKIKQDANLQD